MTGNAAEDVMQLIDVHKSYGGVPALRGVSLSLQPAQIMGLLGPNGAGKSTLFQIAAGLFAPDKGAVRLFGTSYAEGSAAILSLTLVPAARYVPDAMATA